jgi:hypothetical protein
MINQKNKMLSIILGILAVFSLISLACFNSNAKQPTATVPQALPASQESVNNPNLIPTDTTAPKVIEPDPEPEADPETAPVMDTEPLVLVSSGFGQNNQELGYGLKANNPNTNFAMTNIPYQIAVYDKNNAVVSTDGGYIDFIPQGGTLGIGGTIYLDEGVSAAKIEVQLSEGQPVETEATEPFTVENATYVPSEYSSSARGVITNPYDQDITALQVSAILYDETDQIVGGGNTYLGFLLAKGSSGVIIPVSSSKNVSRVEIYPTITSIYDFENTTQMPEGAGNLSIIKQGFGQNNTSLGIGTTIENPNQGYAIESSMYQSTSYANDGSVLGVSTGYISLVLPTQILGIADSQYLDEGAIVSRVDVQIKTGYFTELSSIPMFTSENVTFIPDEYSPQVTGEIVNPYSKEVSNVRVDAIAYNEAGDIIGSGYTYLNFIPANSKAAVSIYVTIAGTPAKVELYAAPSALSDIVE